MKALVATGFAEDLTNMQLQQRELPEPSPNQVRVKMLRAVINPSDFNFIRGDYKDALQRLIWNYQQEQCCFDPARTMPYPEHPYVLGGEGVGIVEACGSSLLARRLKGKRVAISAGPPEGSWQEYTLVDAKKAIPVPEQLSHEQAAMYTINPLSSFAMVRKVLKVEAGEYLLQSAGNSALARMVIALSKEFGFRTINIVRDSSQKDELKSLGADEVIVYPEEDLLEKVSSITGSRGVRYAMDCVGGQLTSDMSRCLSVNTTMLLYGTLAANGFSVNSRDLMMPGCRIEGFFAGNWLAQQSTLKLISTIRQMAKLSAKGIFKAEVAEVFALEDYLKALELSQQPSRGGKVLLSF
ncbi:zinc-dependent alcohol dehydrogenase family protein [uncultured Pseudoteredinibacter sp.]|uniref:zinc-dependent alcohol dehydrogenase family protein n=1 Tax=uncultured Pseudoteredinibacter sp. TaxID=1641701 RepID=UPI002623185A|nr:zinc-dependent alcohol dehydrogenase family protein [uncultured Pseudoteredinibacter sp.]